MCDYETPIGEDIDSGTEAADAEDVKFEDEVSTDEFPTDDEGD